MALASPARGGDAEVEVEAPRGGPPPGARDPALRGEDPVTPEFTLTRKSRGYPDFTGRQLVLRNRLQMTLAEGGRIAARRARLVGRWDHSRYLRTGFEFDLRSQDKPLDYVLRWRPHDAFRVWVGQFKSPTSRSILSSSSALAFIDRSLATEIFFDDNPAPVGARSYTSEGNHGVGRAPGIQFWGDLDPRPGRRLRYYLHATRGLERNRLGDDWVTAFRLELQPRGDAGFQETTYRIRDLRWSLDLGVHHAPGLGSIDLDGDGLHTAADRQDRTIWTLGGVLRHHRLRLQGEAMRQVADPDDPARRTTRSRGGYVHASWLLRPRQWQLAVRWSGLRPDDLRVDQDRHERTVAVTRYLGSRANKLIAEWRRRWDEARPLASDRQARLFFQVQW